MSAANSLAALLLINESVCLHGGAITITYISQLPILLLNPDEIHRRIRDVNYPFIMWQ